MIWYITCTQFLLTTNLIDEQDSVTIVILMYTPSSIGHFHWKRKLASPYPWNLVSQPTNLIKCSPFNRPALSHNRLYIRLRLIIKRWLYRSNIDMLYTHPFKLGRNELCIICSYCRPPKSEINDGEGQDKFLGQLCQTLPWIFIEIQLECWTSLCSFQLSNMTYNVWQFSKFERHQGISV